MCKLNSPEVNYKVSMSREEKTHIKTKYKNKTTTRTRTIINNHKFN
jgi:hypothetical protein